MLALMSAVFCHVERSRRFCAMYFAANHRAGSRHRAWAGWPYECSARLADGCALEFSVIPVSLSCAAMSEANAVIPVGELNKRARQILEREFPLQWVDGEISNLTRATSGHLYFSLKDELAQVRCVMFRSRAQALPWRIDNGQQVEVRALVSLYEARGEFQLSVEGMRRSGLGRLFETFARLKDQLGTDGLFAAERKKALPRYPRAIGIVSSPQAAALRDVVAAIGRRAPHLPLVLYPTTVQGDGAATSIAMALQAAAMRKETDLILLVRGGGSIEDLWAFNEEVVARALATCSLPTVSGIGHESDVTIADYVVDLRAATPTAAAELVTQGWFEAAAEIASLYTALGRAAEYRLASAQQGLDMLAPRLIHPAMRLRIAAGSLNLLESKMKASVAYLVGRRQAQLNQSALSLYRGMPRTVSQTSRISLLSQRLDASLRRMQANRLGTIERISGALSHLNPEAILARGFAIVRDENGHLISDINGLTMGQYLNLRMASGDIDAGVLAIRPG